MSTNNTELLYNTNDNNSESLYDTDHNTNERAEFRYDLVTCKVEDVNENASNVSTTMSITTSEVNETFEKSSDSGSPTISSGLGAEAGLVDSSEIMMKYAKQMNLVEGMHCKFDKSNQKEYSISIEKNFINKVKFTNEENIDISCFTRDDFKFINNKLIVNVKVDCLQNENCPYTIIKYLINIGKNLFKVFMSKVNPELYEMFNNVVKDSIEPSKIENFNLEFLKKLAKSFDSFLKAIIIIEATVTVSVKGHSGNMKDVKCDGWSLPKIIKFKYNEQTMIKCKEFKEIKIKEKEETAKLDKSNKIEFSEKKMKKEANKPFINNKQTTEKKEKVQRSINNINNETLKKVQELFESYEDNPKYNVVDHIESLDLKFFNSFENLLKTNKNIDLNHMYMYSLLLLCKGLSVSEDNKDSGLHKEIYDQTELFVRSFAKCDKNFSSRRKLNELFLIRCRCYLKGPSKVKDIKIIEKHIAGHERYKTYVFTGLKYVENFQSEVDKAVKSMRNGVMFLDSNIFKDIEYFDGTIAWQTLLHCIDATNVFEDDKSDYYPYHHRFEHINIKIKGKLPKCFADLYKNHLSTIRIKKNDIKSPFIINNKDKVIYGRNEIFENMIRNIKNKHNFILKDYALYQNFGIKFPDINIECDTQTLHNIALYIYNLYLDLVYGKEAQKYKMYATVDEAPELASIPDIIFGDNDGSSIPFSKNIFVFGLIEFYKDLAFYIQKEFRPFKVTIKSIWKAILEMNFIKVDTKSYIAKLFRSINEKIFNVDHCSPEYLNYLGGNTEFEVKEYEMFTIEEINQEKEIMNTNKDTKKVNDSLLYLFGVNTDISRTLGITVKDRTFIKSLGNRLNKMIKPKGEVLNDPTECKKYKDLLDLDKSNVIDRLCEMFKIDKPKESIPEKFVNELYSLIDNFRSLCSYTNEHAKQSLIDRYKNQQYIDFEGGIELRDISDLGYGDVSNDELLLEAKLEIKSIENIVNEEIKKIESLIQDELYFNNYMINSRNYQLGSLTQKSNDEIYSIPEKYKVIFICPFINIE